MSVFFFKVSIIFNVGFQAHKYLGNALQDAYYRTGVNSIQELTRTLKRFSLYCNQWEEIGCAVFNSRYTISIYR